MDDKTEKTRKSRAIIDETLSDGSLEEGGSVVDENEGTPGIVVVDQGNEEAGEGVGNASTVFPAELRRRRRHSFERISDNPLWIAKLHYFEEARHERIKREKTGGLLLAGIFTTFDHLRGIRQDIKFGQLSAENRQRREQNVGIISIYDREKMNCAFEIPPPTVWGGGVDGTGGTNDKTAELDYNIYRDSTSITPWFVYVLLMTCSVIFVVSFWVNSWQVEPLSNNPMIGFSYDTMVAMGSLDAHLIVNEGQAYRLVTPWFIHSGILHYLSNVISLGIFALPLEKSHGFFVIATIFFISSYGGSLGSALMLQSSVGMSGGIFGLIGANVVDLWVNAGLMFDHTLIMGKPQSRCLVFSSIVFEVIMLFLLGLTPLVDNYSHFAGFFFGILAGVAVLQPIDTSFLGRKKAHNFLFASQLSTLIIIGLFMALTYVLFGLGAKLKACDWCEILTCVEFPPKSFADQPWWYCDECQTDSLGHWYPVEDRNAEGLELYGRLEITCPSKDVIEVIFDEPTPTIDHLKVIDYCRDLCLGLA